MHFMQVRNEDVGTALLLVSAQLLEQCQHQHTHEQQDLSTVHTQAALDQYAHNILSKRAKYLHQQLASTIRHRANATLCLLSAAASRGGSNTTHLVQALDLTLPAFVKLAHPPK